MFPVAVAASYDAARRPTNNVVGNDTLSNKGSGLLTSLLAAISLNVIISCDSGITFLERTF
jgi:hypothetical protein